MTFEHERLPRFDKEDRRVRGAERETNQAKAYEGNNVRAKQGNDARRQQRTNFRTVRMKTEVGTLLESQSILLSFIHIISASRC